MKKLRADAILHCRLAKIYGSWGLMRLVFMAKIACIDLKILWCDVKIFWYG
jgi:hypothetical protein